jgi:hypothetical protein
LKARRFRLVTTPHPRRAQTPSIWPSNVSDVLAMHGCAVRVTEAQTDAGAGWANKLASAARDWAINALAERIDLPHTIAQPPHAVGGS